MRPLAALRRFIDWREVLPMVLGGIAACRSA
jgi:hypothetical protein